MQINEIKPYRFNPLIDNKNIKDVSIEGLNKLYSVYKDIFKEHKLEVCETFSLKEVYVIMLDFLIKLKICDSFDDGYDDNDDSDKLKNLHQIYYITGKHHNYAKIDLHDIYKERKNRELFDVLVYLIKLTSYHINLLDEIDDYYMSEDHFNTEFYGEIDLRDECPTNYFASKEYHKLIVPFMKYIRGFEKEYSKKEVYTILSKHKSWRKFAYSVYEFLKNPSSIQNFCHYKHPSDDYNEDFQPTNVLSYWGFSWNPETSCYNQFIVEHYECYAQEGGEESPIISFSYLNREQKENEFKKIEVLYKFLRQ